MKVEGKIRLLWLISAISYTLVLIILTVSLLAPDFMPFGVMINGVLFVTGTVSNAIRWNYLRDTKEARKVASNNSTGEGGNDRR